MLARCAGSVHLHTASYLHTACAPYLSLRISLHTACGVKCLHMLLCIANASALYLPVHMSASRLYCFMRHLPRCNHRLFSLGCTCSPRAAARSPRRLSTTRWTTLPSRCVQFMVHGCSSSWHLTACLAGNHLAGASSWWVHCRGELTSRLIGARDEQVGALGSTAWLLHVAIMARQCCG